MPRTQTRTITFTIDGREVQAPENAMLVDAAKLGDVEIPVFCYEPKLGGPVGACRMCLVEIEGIPKLQTGCSTPVKDGMVVHTQTERVQAAQRGVVEFLLVNHPLDCPVCDKGGECPLQDIAFGWGGGVSRHIEPKRHFVKPLRLSSEIAIDRERCILCYRCVRFSQDVSEDHQLVLLERGAHSYVATFDGHPYEAPFSGNIVELCPVGALTALPYRFKARPWDIEDAGTVCTLCPSQCNVTLTVRDEKVLRVLARDNHEVDDGWLCNRGRFARREIHSRKRVTEPLIRDGGSLRPVPWERALEEAAGLLRRAGSHSAAVIGGQSTNEEAFLLARTMREGLGSPHVDSRPAGTLPLALHRGLGDPALQASTSDLEHADVVLVLDCEPIRDMPILDLRVRKGVRHKGVKLAVASDAQGALDRKADLSMRFAPGMGAVFAQALAAALAELRGHGSSAPGGESGIDADVDRLAGQAGADARSVRDLAQLLTGAGKDLGGVDSEVAILWGERLTVGEQGAAGAAALLEIARSLGLAEIDGAGLLEVPSGSNARGLREVGALPNAGPGLSDPAPLSAATNGGGSPEGLDVNGIGKALAEGELSAVHLLHCDPLSELGERETWERALSRAGVIAHASVLSESLAEHADVVFPAESHAEKEGTVVHPDGRIQRLRPAIARQGQTRAEWLVIAEIALQLGLDLGVANGPMATAQLVQEIPFYAGLTLEEIGGRGVRWQERPAASAFPASEGSR
ncbi:MAG TPA: NADH-quinone oxidoreductase subunit NuoG [Solirubrobacteraceae bacterium]|jgi:NADH-quinone oxidoreductase subunit G